MRAIVDQGILVVTSSGSGTGREFVVSGSSAVKSGQLFAPSPYLLGPEAVTAA